MWNLQNKSPLVTQHSSFSDHIMVLWGSIQLLTDKSSSTQYTNTSTMPPQHQQYYGLSPLVLITFKVTIPTTTLYGGQKGFPLPPPPHLGMRLENTVVAINWSYVFYCYE